MSCCLFDRVVCLSACLVFVDLVCVWLCVCPSLQQQQQSANLPINALGPPLSSQLASSQTPLHSTPPPAAGGATNPPHPQPSSRSSTPTLPGCAPAPVQGATPPCPTQPQPQAELSAAAQTQQPLPQPPTTPVRQSPSACPPMYPPPPPPVQTPIFIATFQPLPFSSCIFITSLIRGCSHAYVCVHAC